MNRLWGILLVVAALLVGGVAVAEGERKPAIYAEWRYLPSTDPITDEDTSLLVTRPVEYPQLGRLSEFGVGCHPEGILGADGVVVLLAGSDYVPGDSVEVTWRVDSREPVTEVWAANGTSVRPRAGDATRALIVAMLDGESLALRHQASGSRVTYVFPIGMFRAGLWALGCYTGQL